MTCLLNASLLLACLLLHVLNGRSSLVSVAPLDCTTVAASSSHRSLTSQCYSEDIGSLPSGGITNEFHVFVGASDGPWSCKITCSSFTSSNPLLVLEYYGADDFQILDESFSCGSSYTMPYPLPAALFLSASSYDDMKVTCFCEEDSDGTPPTGNPPSASPPTASPPTASPPEECFSGETLVNIAGVDDLVQMKHLQVGDAVLTKSGAYKPMYAYGRIKDNHPTVFHQIHTTAMSKPLEITSDHMLFVVGKAGPIRAGTVEVGDFLLGATKDDLHKVVDIKQIIRNEIYFPLTTDGTIVVNGIAASTYADVQDGGNEYFVLAGLELPFTKAFLSHIWYSPLRLWCFGVSSGPCLRQDKDGFNSWDSFGDALVKFAERQEGFLMRLTIYSLMMIGPAITMSIEFLVGPSFGPLILSMVIAVAISWNTIKDYRKKR